MSYEKIAIRGLREKLEELLVGRKSEFKFSTRTRR